MNVHIEPNGEGLKISVSEGYDESGAAEVTEFFVEMPDNIEETIQMMRILGHTVTVSSAI